MCLEQGLGTICVALYGDIINKTSGVRDAGVWGEVLVARMDKRFCLWRGPEQALAHVLCVCVCMCMCLLRLRAFRLYHCKESKLSFKKDPKPAAQKRSFFAGGPSRHFAAASLQCPQSKIIVFIL